MIFSRTAPPSGFYVYAYLRLDGTPYYIGKGIRKRAWINHRSHNCGVHTPKESYRIIIIEHNLTEVGSFATERKLIRWYGRKDLGTGILLNKTDGGEGSSNRILSENTKIKIGLANSGKSRTSEQNIANSNRQIGKKRGPHSIETRLKLSQPRKPCRDETKKNISKAKIGHKLGPQTEEHKLKRSLLLTGKVQQIVTCPHCGKSGGISTMGRWHFDNCKLTN
jgi:hypothetical protein